MALFAEIFRWIRSSIRLSECRIKEAPDDMEVFTHKGKTYNRKQFVELWAGTFERMKTSKLENAIYDARQALPKSKKPEYDAAILDAYVLALSRK